MGAVKTLFTFEEFEKMEFKPGQQELIQKRNLTIHHPDGSSVLTMPLISGFSLRIADVFGA